MMKSIYTLVFSIISFCITTTAFSQDFTDQEIGFDLGEVMNELKERGFSDSVSVKSEIEKMRVANKIQYIEMKRIESELLQKSQPKNLLKVISSEISTDVSQSEKAALKALYDSAGGINWINNTGWDFSTPVTSWDPSTKTGWYGIIVIDKQIQYLNLYSNNLKGYIPEEIGMLKYLTSLYLQNNSLGGIIPSSIGELTELLNLGLQNNKLTGFIPEEISQLTKLRNLILTRNTLAGTIPRDISNLTNLINLWLNYNQLTGPLPLQIGNLSSLQFLDLGYNKLNGTIPPSFYNLTRLITFYIENNSLSGLLSSEISKLVSLRDLRISSNQLSGEIPAEMGQLSRLSTLDLRANKLTGSIPPEIGQLRLLVSLILYGNMLSGEIPTEIKQLDNLDVLWLHNNRFTGNIPSEIKGLVKLRYLYLYGNQLSGSIPDLSSLTLLKRLKIESNKFRFIDFENQFISLKSRVTNDFTFSPQARTDTVNTITSAIGGSTTLTMYEDGRFTPDETFQWYKNNFIILGATSRQYMLTNLKASDSGVYTCKAYHTTNPDMSPLVLEREPLTLNVINCIPIVGSIKVIR
ncbi:hypothetical protein [Flavobacterium sp. AJR]|uniref:leucine-rich repeat domain-containing protein n=1 Tax=Flavobacterium sp. AJR TaxID=1979369 RepID=UPI000A3D8339|nr:hypothetical protein [Flavobacterium sp. AJR]OUL60460.1 hypothetical protein B8T70_20245 [Flavobacterium sp. AJR]